MVSTEDRDALNDLFLRTDDEFTGDDPADIIQTPVLVIDLDEVNGEAARQAKLITERLSNYFFDEQYIKQHPYIPSKIAQEMDNIRRLLKMLTVNERAQDALIANITSNAGKGSLYSSLTSLQNSTLSIQSQLNQLIANIEIIFKEMQENCEKTFAEKEKEEQANEDGSMTVRGSREFIKSIQEQYNSATLVKTLSDGTKVDITTGEILNEEIENEATAEDILGVV